MKFLGLGQDKGTLMIVLKDGVPSRWNNVSQMSAWAFEGGVKAMKKVCLRYLSQEDILALELSYERILSAVEAVLRAHGKGQAQMPPKPAVFPRKGRYSYFHAMPAYVASSDICGIKWLGRASHNPKLYGLPQFTGLLVLNDPETGVPIAVMDCRWITAVRTAAVSVITALCCANSGPKTLGIVGTGLQGRFHALMMVRAFPTLDTLYVSNRSSVGLEAFLSDVGPRLQVRLVPAIPEELVRNSDIVVSAGVRELTYHLDWIAPGTLCIGLDLARAWSPEVLSGVDKTFVDDAQQFWDRYRTEPEAFSARPEVTGELSHVLMGIIPGRDSEDDRILSLNVGMAICDLALGDLIYREAEKRNIGVLLPLMEKDDLLPPLCP